MAHVKRPGSISKVLAPGPPPCATARPTRQSQEEHRGLVKQESEPLPCTSKDVDNEQLTGPVPAQRHYISCDPRPEDMEDTCSEYDNVGSDVEQDYDEVLHLQRYYKPYCPEDADYLKHPVAENNNESSGAVEQFTPRARHDTQVCQLSQAETKSTKAGHRFINSTPIARGPSKCDIGKGQENNYFFSDGDEIEEVLVGVKFIEDLDETEQNTAVESSHYQCRENENIETMVNRDREQVARNRNNPGLNRKSESDQMGSRENEKQCKGRGRRGTGEDMECIVSGIKACSTTSTEQRPKSSSKDHKKTAVRTKTRTSSCKPHPLPPPRHTQPVPQPPANTQKAVTACKETSPVLNQEGAPGVSKPNLASHQPTEQQSGHLEERQSGPGTAQQEEKTSTAIKPEHLSEQPKRPQCPEPLPAEEHNSPVKTQEAPSFPCFEDVPGPCEPEDLIDGIIFAANYLGCTQVLSDKNPTKSVRMSQAQEAVTHIKSQDEDSQMMTEVDLFISTKAVKVLNADTQETMMDSALRTISYIADIGNIVVVMARRPMSQSSSEDLSECPVSASEGKSQYRMICYVFESEDAQLIAQSIGQAFSVAYREFLRANGINPTDLSQKQYSDIINSQEMYHDDLIHFSNSDNCKELYIEKPKGESLGVVIVESGWGSILPTVILAGMFNSGPAARSGKLSVGDQIMSINDTSLVGLPLATCQGIIKGLKNHVKVKLSIVSCPPVTTVLIKRPDLKYQLGFSVQNGIICSLMRGGIAERGGVRVGHRIIEINGQSVVAMAHEKIVQTLSISVGEINMKTMPAVMFRLLTGQETPVYI